MKKKISNILKIIIPIIITIIVIIFTVKSFGSDNEDDLKSKANQELVYIENKLISIANKVNNISFGHYVISESKIEDNLQNSRF